MYYWRHVLFLNVMVASLRLTCLHFFCIWHFTEVLPSVNISDSLRLLQRRCCQSCQPEGRRWSRWGCWGCSSGWEECWSLARWVQGPFDPSRPFHRGRPEDLHPGTCWFLFERSHHQGPETKEKFHQWTRMNLQLTLYFSINVTGTSNTSFTFKGLPLKLCLLTFSTAFFMSSSVLNSTTLQGKSRTFKIKTYLTESRAICVFLSCQCATNAN